MAKVLLVEDDNNLREIYQARLTAEGYDIVTAQNGEEALVVAKQNKPDLIISDVMMPRISGFEMLDILRNTDELKHTKVIMLTALGQTDDQKRANSLGADRYLVKSQVTLEDIVNAAKELLDEDATTPAPVGTTTTATPAPATVAATPVAVAPAPDAAAAPAAVTPTVVDTPMAVAPEPEQPAPVGATTTATPADAPAVPAAPAPAAATPDPAPTPAQPAAPAPAPEAPAEPTPEPAANDAPAPATPPKQANSNDAVTVAGKKIIQPISSPTAKPDLDALLAKEEAKDGPAPVAPVVNGAPAQPPAEAPATKPAQGFDPTTSL